MYVGVVQKFFAWKPPNRRPVQSRSNVGQRCRFCFKFRRLISSAGLPLYNWKKEGSDVARMGRGSLVELVQSPSNRGQSWNSAAKLGFAASSPCQQADLESIVWPCANQINFQDSKGNFSSSPRKQNQRDVRRHHATSKLIINSLPFRGPIAGLPRLEFTNRAV